MTAFVGVRSSQSLQGIDFPNLYCAARMVFDGHGHQLYDAALQRQYQAHYAGGVGTLNLHPPFESVLFLSVAWLPLRQAYLLWFTLDLVFLMIAARMLVKDALPQWDWRVCFAAALVFVPLLLSLLQGQDSLFFLLVMVIAFIQLRNGRSFAAGCWLGFGLCKFQITLPLTLALLLSQRGKARIDLAKGFSLIALALAALSFAISGWPVFTVYLRFLVSIQSQPTSGIAPQVMANLRGLIYLMNLHSSLITTAALSISTVALIYTLAVWKRSPSSPGRKPSELAQNPGFDVAYAHTVIFAILVSFYLNPHDLTLLLLPIALLTYPTLSRPWLQWRPVDWITLGLMAILFLPPIPLWTLRAHYFGLMALPIVALFLISYKVADT